MNQENHEREKMQQFDELIKIIDHLLGPEGCPWDQKQTLHSLRSSILEEVCELIEAIDLEDDAHIQEELGDLFFNVVFLSKVAEKEKKFTTQAVLQELNEKLIRRHPHVFGEGKKLNSVEELYQQWDAIKKEEKGKERRQSLLDGISKHLPSLSRTQKILKKIKKTDFSLTIQPIENPPQNEEELGQRLLSLVHQAQEKGLDAEHALRKVLAHIEQNFLEYEKN